MGRLIRTLNDEVLPLQSAKKPADHPTCDESDNERRYPPAHKCLRLSTSRFGSHVLGSDAKAKDERWQLAHERPAQEAGERKGAFGVECGFQQAILHEIDDGLDDSRGQFAPALDAGEIGNGHMPCLKWGGEDICSCYGVNDGIVNAIASCW